MPPLVLCLPLTLAGIALGWRARGRLAASGARAHGPERDAFTALRLHDTAPPPAANFLGIAEVLRFEGMRRTLGYRQSSAVLDALSGRIADLLPLAAIGRSNRTSIEFAFAADDAADAEARLAAAVRRLEEPLEIDGLHLALSLRIGFGEVPAGGITDELIDGVTAAIGAADNIGRKVAAARAPGRGRDAGDALQLVHDLSAAIRGDELTVHYQPKLDCRTNGIRSAEALVRWTHPTRGAISPELFVGLAEEAGLIRELTQKVVASVVRDLPVLADAGHRLTVFVNISGVLLADRDFAERILEQVAPIRGQIGFEITETAVIADPDAAMRNLRDFADAGVRLAIDDYGSGLSSLSYLKQLPAHELKIDRMFVREITESQIDPLLVRSSIDLAHALEMVVTAEGVDDPMALSLLRIMGCDMVQGFIISRPLPLPELIAFLRDGGGQSAAAPARLLPRAVPAQA